MNEFTELEKHNISMILVDAECNRKHGKTPDAMRACENGDCTESVWNSLEADCPWLVTSRMAALSSRVTTTG